MNVLLIVSAIKEELQDLEFLNKKNIVINDKNYEIMVFPLGIGKLNSIFTLLVWYYENYKVNYRDVQSIEILFVGSCGSYLENYKNDFIYSNIFTNYDFAVLTDKAKSLPDISTKIQTNTGAVANAILKLYDWDFGIVNSTDSITLTKVDITNFMLKHDDNTYIYENLEVYGVAKFCKELLIPFTSFLCITNVVDEMGSENWKKNYRYLSKKMNEILKNYFLSILD